MCIYESDLDFADICRDEKCARTEVHAAHGPVLRDRSRNLFRVSRRQLVLDAVYGAVDSRMVKPFSRVLTDVLHDYGSLKERTVYRALHELQLRRQVALVVPSGSSDHLRRHGFVKGCYIRYDSPLLWEPDGIHTLFEQVDDLRGDLVGKFFAPVSRTIEARVN